MKHIFAGILILISSTLYGQAAPYFFPIPTTISDGPETPLIRSMLEKFRLDSSMNGQKLPPGDFQPYAELIQHATVALTEFELFSPDTSLNFLALYPDEFRVVDKSPLYCFCHQKRFKLDADYWLQSDESGERYTFLTFGAGRESFSDLSVTIIMSPQAHTLTLVHSGDMDYTRLKSGNNSSEWTFIQTEQSELILGQAPAGSVAGRFQLITNRLPFKDGDNFRFKMAGEFSCKIE